MKEYKVIDAKNTKKAEVIMNEMAQQGWRVISTAVWTNFQILLTITFERDK
ncbi:DUF4177 domain-containing protein [Clostridium gasigenes]|uniref:DUF4177 domain-containing protein n=1 Tax=Clostridium gasigenes TaxID=94869 RepID=UPI001C0BE4F5|nr:DUF4177 domain-containing protein [Clostridium gasigenes]MBU3102978.1 DUF4177 domain-containing protein [Clostridium gasigenes]